MLGGKKKNQKKSSKSKKKIKKQGPWNGESLSKPSLMSKKKLSNAGQDNSREKERAPKREGTLSTRGAKKKTGKRCSR